MKIIDYRDQSVQCLQLQKEVYHKYKTLIQGFL